MAATAMVEAMAAATAVLDEDHPLSRSACSFNPANSRRCVQMVAMVIMVILLHPHHASPAG